MHKIISQVAIAITLAFLLGCNVDAGTNADWSGAYFYEHEIGEGAGGVASFIEYNLTLDGNDICKLEIVGLQSNENILCKATTNNGAIAIEFRSYANGEIKNSLGITVYSVGSTLFSLKKENSIFITHWQSLQPDDIKNRSGEYFISAK